MAIDKKPDFNTPADQVETGELKAAKASTGEVAVAPLLGTWNNCDKDTRGIVKIVITDEHGLTVQVFGACSPTPCDWGKVKGIAYAANVSSSRAVAFSAAYKFSFKETIVVGVLDHGSLIVETFNHFTDASGRSNYHCKDLLCKH